MGPLPKTPKKTPIPKQYRKSSAIKLPKSFIPKKAKTPVCNFLLVREAKAKFYTGLGEKKRRVWWEFLSDCKSELEIIGHPEKKKTGELLSLSVECQFLMTLMILRRNQTYTEISLLFNIGNSILVGQVFKTWLQFFFYEAKEFENEWFIKAQDLPKPLPKCTTYFCKKKDATVPSKSTNNGSVRN